MSKADCPQGEKAESGAASTRVEGKDQGLWLWSDPSTKAKDSGTSPSKGQVPVYPQRPIDGMPRAVAV